MGQLEERNESRLQEVKKKTADEARSYYLQCFHQIVNSKGQKRPSDWAVESHDRSHDVGVESHGTGRGSHNARMELGLASHDARMEPGLTSRGVGSGSHDTGLKSRDTQPGSRGPTVKSVLKHTTNRTMESHDTGLVAKSSRDAASKLDSKKRTMVPSSSPKRDRLVSRVTSSLPDNEPGVTRGTQKSLSKDVVSHKVVTGKPRSVTTSKFVPKTKLILHTESSKMVSPKGMYWAREKDRLAGRIADHQ